MSTATQTEFVSEAFDTHVSDNAIDSLLSRIDSCVGELRARITNDDTVENLLRPDGSQYLLRSGMSVDNQDPEPLTQETIIQPILSELGYSELRTEVSGSSTGRDMVADYSFRISNKRIDSDQLLIEAEPLNKKLEGRGHGVDQVENWLSQREFESDYGFATDGLRWVFIRYDADSYAHNRIEDIDLGGVFLKLFYNKVGEQLQPRDALSDEDIQTISDFLQTFEYHNFISIASDADQIIRATQEEITDKFYDEYIRIVFGVRRGVDDRSPRSLVGDGIIAPNEATAEDTRLFAVKLMNRLVFVKFLEDKGIVVSDLLTDISDIYGDGGGYTRSLYSEFIEPLFFEVMNRKPESRTKHVNNIDLFQKIPYLNGGLFRPALGESELDERGFDVENTVMKEVIELLENYEFSAEGGPTDLDPSVLGNVFEKTINYLTTNPGDRNKELGAYYTPKEITRFCAEYTVRPALKERIEWFLIEERGWNEQEIDYESIYGLLDDLPSKTSFITQILDEVIDAVRVVDPAMGSGHFLTSVLEEIVNIRRSMYAKIGWETSDHRLKKETVQNNIYGVDIVGPAVEIGKLRLWLSVISEVTEDEVEQLGTGELALPNIAFNLRQGNSLIGYTEFPETTEDGRDRTLEGFQEDSVRMRYKEIIDHIRLYEQKGWEAEPEAAEEHRRKAFDLIEKARVELVDDLHRDFSELGLDVKPEKVASYDPFNWVLEFAEVYAEGGFDVIVGNPPWDRIKPLRDDYFSKFEPDFRTLMPDVKDRTQEQLLEKEEIAEGWDEYHRDLEIQAEYFKNGYELQKPKIDGKTKPNPNDLSALFFERVFNLGSKDSYVAQVLPGVIWTGAAAKDLRSHLLDEAKLEMLSIFENKGIFKAIHQQYKFGVVVFRNSGDTDTILGKYQQGNVGILRNFEDNAVRIPVEILERYSPEARIFPFIESAEKRDVLETMIRHPPLGTDVDGGWYMEPYQGLRRTNIADRLVDEDEGDYPIYGGGNIYQYTYKNDFFEDLESPQFWSVEAEKDPERSAKRRMKEKTLGDLKKSIYDTFEGTGSQKQFVNQLLEGHRGRPLEEDDVRLDCSEYRIVLRDVSNATNERTVIATVLPKGVMVHNTLRTIRNFSIVPYEEGLSEFPLHQFYQRIFSDRELFVALGLINSLPFDYIMRTKVDTHIVTYKFKETQVPRLTEGSDWFEYIWERSAQLNCYGDRFQEMRTRLDGIEPAIEIDQRKKLQAQIDAAAFHAYNLNQDETRFVLDDFYRVNNPRMMTDSYFELVFEVYDELA